MASTHAHTLGAKCRLAPVQRVERDDGQPSTKAQFFYSSVIPIDDPLSTSSVSGPADSRSSKSQLRPFGQGDNNALEKAWLSLISEPDRRAHHAARQRRASHAAEYTEKLAALVQALARQHWEKHRTGYQPQDLSAPSHGHEALPNSTHPLCCSELLCDVSEKLHQAFCAVVRKRSPALAVDRVVHEVVLALNHLRHEAGDLQPGTASSANARLQVNTRIPRAATEPQDAASPRRGTDSYAYARPRSISLRTNQSSPSRTPIGSPAPARLPLVDDGISGKPFVRVGSPESQPESSPGSFSRLDGLIRGTEPPQGEIQQKVTPNPSRKRDTRGPGKEEPESVEVAVGVSRLHMVAFPMLQMKPIYWSPINDVAVVMRATWFYRDTMLPIPPPIANQLEAGYQELRPWSETWRDEIRCAIEVGPLGEEKVSHQLWPKEADVGYADNNPWEPSVSSDPFCASHCFQGDAAAEGSVEPLISGSRGATEPPIRGFSNYHVIYKNDGEAFLLKPSLKPSAYYGRRPVAKIMRGVTVGVPIVRGFNRHKWEEIHQKRQTPNKAGQSAANESHESTGQGVCPACKAEKERGQVTDLVLVAHGIGQKFAERVESFHFTHAINGFRRAVNIELKSPLVQQVLREGQNGMMILPLNWRMGLSFEDGGPMREEDKNDYTPEGFGLKDIEPETIPAVRSLISDVMFDIPFYMSHHKGKMIKALVSEANRVYRLWCRNNPGFAEKGRVHLIGHSLGSAMAVEVLSHQPTAVPRLDLSAQEPETRFFEFDTTNLFLAGSPAGFFLLLERGVLMPRRGRLKPGADASDTIAKEVVGEAGTYGCLAVDNIYNVLAKEDPIAYLLNGAVDPNYASSLRVAYVPTTAVSIFKSMGDAVRHVVPGMAPAPNPLAPEPERPSTVRLPSQLELEVHDFTREEIAERKAFLLNDNGQIDWYLRSGGGPLEIQYLNMLSAHTSYWTNNDFIRMLCIEVGRTPGRTYTLPAMRAVKAAKRLLAD